MQVAQSKIAKQPGQAQTAKQIAEHTQRQANQAQDKTTHQTSQTANQTTTSQPSRRTNPAAN